MKQLIVKIKRFLSLLLIVVFSSGCSSNSKRRSESVKIAKFSKIIRTTPVDKIRPMLQIKSGACFVLWSDDHAKKTYETSLINNSPDFKIDITEQEYVKVLGTESSNAIVEFSVNNRKWKEFISANVVFSSAEEKSDATNDLRGYPLKINKRSLVESLYMSKYESVDCDRFFLLDDIR